MITRKSSLLSVAVWRCEKLLVQFALGDKIREALERASITFLQLEMTDLAPLVAVPAVLEDDDSLPVASTSRNGLCSVCSVHAAKYTCPRCTIKTCSLGCTRSHKAATSCSGERDRVSYVGMNQYGDVGMWRDLSYLRDVKNKVGEWGKAAQISNGRPSSNKGKERERDGQAVPERLLNLSNKEQAFKKQMIHRGVEVLFLPKEMERHTQNRSNWNTK